MPPSLTRVFYDVLSFPWTFWRHYIKRKRVEFQYIAGMEDDFAKESFKQRNLEAITDCVIVDVIQHLQDIRVKKDLEREEAPPFRLTVLDQIDLKNEEIFTRSQVLNEG